MMKQYINEEMKNSKVVGEPYEKNGVKYVTVMYQPFGQAPKVKEITYNQYIRYKHGDIQENKSHNQQHRDKRKAKLNEREQYKQNEKQIQNEIKGKKRVYGKPDIFKIQKYETLLEKRLYSSKFDTQIIYETNQKKLRYKVDERKYKHFNMMIVRNEIDPPTNNPKEVEQMIMHYLSTRFKYLKGIRIQVEFSFDESPMTYRTNEMIINDVNDDSKSIFESLVAEKIGKWEIDQQKYNDANLFECNAFTLYIDLSIREGGCFNNKITIDGLRKEKLARMLYTPMNKEDNNCLIYCMLYHSQSKMNNRGSLKIGKIANDAKKCQDIRKQYFKHSNQIKVSEIGIIADHFETKINLYTYEKREFQFSQSYGDYKKEANILLVGFHYHLILHDNLVKMKYCKKCRTMILDYKKHANECNYCCKCKMPYKGEHSKEDCDYNINHYTGENAIKVANVDKNFDALNKIIYADFETIKEINILSPYGIAFAIDYGETIVYKGKDCLDHFLDDMLKLKGKFTLVFYNGSRFDLYFVYQGLINRGEKVEEQNFIFANGSFKRFQFNGITTFDLNLHLTGSLKSNCKAFNVNKDKSKGEFDHRRIVSWESVDELESEWLPYLKLDIISMRELYTIYAKQVWTDFKLNVNKYITLSSMAEKVWRCSLTEKIDLLTFDDDEWVRRSIYGGRAYMCKQYFESKDDDDYLLDCDVVSLYPTAMHDYMYPIGDIEKIEESAQLNKICERINEKSFKAFKFYIIECDIKTNKKLVNAVLPRRGDNSGLIWDLHNIENGVYNSVDIERALRHGYEITKIHRFMGFKKVAYCFKDYIDQIFQMKQKAEKDTPKYHLAKLLLNSLYGKTLQKPVIEKHLLITTYDELENIRQENEIAGYKFVDEDKLFVTYIPFDKDEQVRKPSYIGSFILGYSRQIMDKYYDAIDAYTNIEKTFWRCDTDSMIVHRKQYEKFKELGFMQAGVLGMLDLDIKGKIMKYCEPNPKCYCCLWTPFDKKDVEKLKKKDDVVYVGDNSFLHIRCKSFSKKDQLNLTMNDYTNMLFHKKAKESKQELIDEYGNEYGFISRKDDKVTLFMSDKLKKVGFNISSKQKERGISFSSITSESFIRTMNMTEWNKRQHIKDHPNVASLPFGYCGRPNGINRPFKF